MREKTLYTRLHDLIAALPGVASTAIAGYTPLSGDSWNDGVYPDGAPVPDRNVAMFERVSPGYFDAIGNPILKGRAISTQDTDGAPRVAVVNEAFARRFFPRQDPIGRHFGRSEKEATRLYEIVGVAKDARYATYNIELPIEPFFFLPVAQHDVSSKPSHSSGDVRTHFLGDIVVAMRPGAALSDAAVRRAVAAVDPNLPVIRTRTLADQVSGQFRQQRLIARLTSLFGLLSLILASVGLYGVTAHNASRRTNEIGVRMALGAGRGNVVALVLRGAFTLIALGLLAGIPLSIVAGHLLDSQLYGMKPWNATVTIVSVVALGLAALVAALIPALKAGSISPVDALRSE